MLKQYAHSFPSFSFQWLMKNMKYITQDGKVSYPIANILEMDLILLLAMINRKFFS
jgi:hypothetical protein